MKGGSGDPPGPLADVVDAAIPAWAVHMRNKTLGKGPSMKDETKYAPFARASQDRELSASEAFDLRPSATRVNVVQTIRDTRWVLTCGVIQAKTPVRARSVAQGFQDPDLQHQLVETAGCVSIRLSHSQLLTLCAPEEWRIWSLDVQNAFLRADPCHRGVLSTPFRNGGHNAVCALGNSAWRHMVLMISRRHFATLPANIFRIKVAATRKLSRPFAFPTTVRARNTSRDAWATRRAP